MCPVIAGNPSVKQVYDFTAAHEPSKFSAKDKGRPRVHLQMLSYVPEAYVHEGTRTEDRRVIDEDVKRSRCLDRP